MKDEAVWMRVLRSNWHLLIVLTLVLVGAIALALRPEPAAKADAAAVQMEVQTTLKGSTTPEKSRWAKPTKAEKNQEAIDKYVHEINENPNSLDTPHNLFRLANLYYSDLRDYDKASLYYLTLLQDYPDYREIQNVYVNLIVCYERLGQFDLKRATLEKMMSYYGQGTEQYKFAEQELSGM